MKKILVLFMVFSLLLTSAFAGGSSESTASDAAKEVTAEDLAGITLEFWHAQTGENGVAMDKVVALFNETNEYGITVNATCQGGYNDCHNKVLSALSAGTAPNISQAYISRNCLWYIYRFRIIHCKSLINVLFYHTGEINASSICFILKFPSCPVMDIMSNLTLRSIIFFFIYTSAALMILLIFLSDTVYSGSP